MTVDSNRRVDVLGNKAVAIIMAPRTKKRAGKARCNVVARAVDSADFERLDVRSCLVQRERTGLVGAGCNMSRGLPPDRTITPFLELLPQ